MSSDNFNERLNDWKKFANQENPPEGFSNENNDNTPLNLSNWYTAKKPVNKTIKKKGPKKSARFSNEINGKSLAEFAEFKYNNAPTVINRKGALPAWGILPNTRGKSTYRIPSNNTRRLPVNNPNGRNANKRNANKRNANKRNNSAITQKKRNRENTTSRVLKPLAQSRAPSTPQTPVKGKPLPAKKWK